MPSEGIQGDEWGAYVTLDTYNRDERGIAYGARALGRRSARSSRRRHDLPRRTVTPSTGRRGTGDRTRYDREVCEMQKAERCWVSSVSAPHGINHRRARRGETRTAGSAGGRTEKDLHHRHLAVRPTHPSKSPGGGSTYTGRSISSARSSTSSSPRNGILRPLTSSSPAHSSRVHARPR